MKKLLVIVVLLFLSFSMNSMAQNNERATAFEKIRFVDNHPYFMYESDWCEILKIENVSIDKYIALAKEQRPTDWKYSIVRYTHYLMDDMEISVQNKVSVCFERNGKIFTKDLEIKKRNRDLATKFYFKTIGLNRSSRKHSIRIPTKYLYLNTRLDSYKKTENNWLSREDAFHDLEHLEWQIVNNYSYINLRGFDYALGIDAIIAGLKEGISKRDFAMQVKMFMANFGDGHSRVSMRYLITNSDLSALPFEIIKKGNKFYALSGKKHDLYNKEFPILKSINGFTLSHLYSIAERFISKTTHKFVEKSTVEYLYYMKFILALAGQKNVKTVSVEFTDGNKDKIEKIDLGKYKYYPLLKRYDFKQKIFKDNIGYIAFNRHMGNSKKFISTLHKAMQKVRKTKSLIIDIRGNGGGSREPLLALLPYFIKKPVVANVARYRVDAVKDIHPKNGYLAHRLSYPETYTGFSNKERDAIKEFKTFFNPTRILSSKKYTDYHYMLVSPIPENGTYYYDKEVLVLVDQGCFSASDIFAAGIILGDKVRLLGNRTGGGSGASEKKYLPNSNIKVKLSSMFSYQPNGLTYDSNGVMPDYNVDYTLDDSMGKTDTQLDKAKAILKK